MASEREEVKKGCPSGQPFIFNAKFTPKGCFTTACYSCFRAWWAADDAMQNAGVTPVLQPPATFASESGGRQAVQCKTQNAEFKM
ncbi:MAG: hypothetical protein IKC66_08245 [Alistipes sp.]|nr:hypothetical protein [Alistipes sp.]